MTGNLDDAIKTLLIAALPELLGGAAPAVALAVSGERFAADPQSADAVASEPRPDDQVDHFPFDPAGFVFDPAAPTYDPAALPSFTLVKPPYPGAKRVRLVTAAGDRLPLRETEVLWDELEPRRFTLALAPARDLAGVNGVQVLYGVIAVFTLLKLNQTLSIRLEAAAAEQLAACEALVTGVLELRRQELLDNSQATYDGGDYRATVKAISLKLLEGTSPAPTRRLLTYLVEVELKTTRALRGDEGRPIAQIRTPGRPVDPARRVNIDPGVDA